MNLPLVSKHLGIVAVLIGLSMLFSLPWAWPALGVAAELETEAIFGLGASIAISCVVGVGLIFLGRRADGQMFRREAMAVVGLSWVLATILGALPFLLSGTCRGPGDDDSSVGIPMTIADALFESSSGFSGTGATVISDLENPKLVPRAILFWRSETHFLGGLGILVLFVAVLGQGASAKAVMRAELPGPTMETQHARIQQTARAFAGIYVGLNVILTAILLAEGMNGFDALCHSFGTIATGGFSTYNSSVAFFDSVAIDTTITIFMAISCVNFALLYAVILRQPGKLIRDSECQAYLGILLGAIGLIAGFGLYHSDFANFGEALRYGSFQVTSILTNTGFATQDFDRWNGFGQGLLLILMFIGGCAGSTSCSIKVVRYLLLFKGLSAEVERTYRPNVVRTIRMDNRPIDPQLITHVYLYFGLVLVVFVVSWLALLLLEPAESWTIRDRSEHAQFLDCATAVAACLNGVGPGLGLVGPAQNYAPLQESSKLLLTFVMLLGRLEIIPLLVLFMPRYWRDLG